MANTKKIRAYQLAMRLFLPFKEFQKHAEALGVTFRSAQNSMDEDTAMELLARIEQQMAQAEPKVAPPSPQQEEEKQENSAPIFRPIPIHRPKRLPSQGREPVQTFRTHRGNRRYNSTPHNNVPHAQYWQQHRVGER